MTKESAIVFDLDGTLVDTAPGLTQAANKLLASLNLQSVDVETYSGFIGGGITKQVKNLLNYFGYEYSGSQEPYVKKFKEFYYEDPLYETKAYPFVKETLNLLKDKNYELAICTQKNEKPARYILRHFGLEKFFSGFAFGDSLKVMKPDPKMVDLATKAFSFKSLIYVGDSLTDSMTAKNSQAKFILFTEGYRSQSIDQISPYHHFSHYRKLPEIIEQLRQRSQG